MLDTTEPATRAWPSRTMNTPHIEPQTRFPLLREKPGMPRVIAQGLAMMLAASATIAPLAHIVAPQHWLWRALISIVVSVASVTTIKLFVRRRAWLVLGWFASSVIALWALVPRPISAWELDVEGLSQFDTDTVVIDPGPGIVWLLALGSLAVVGVLLALLEFSPTPALSGLVIAAPFGVALFYTTERMTWCAAAIVIAYLAVLTSYRRGTPRPARGASVVPSAAASAAPSGRIPKAGTRQRLAGAAAGLAVSIVAAIVASVIAPHTALWEAAYGFESPLGPQWSGLVSTSLDVGASRDDAPDRLIGTVMNGRKSPPEPLRLYTAKDFDGETWTAEPPPSLPDAAPLVEYDRPADRTSTVFLKYGAPEYLPAPPGPRDPMVWSNQSVLFDPISSVAALAAPSTDELSYEIASSSMNLADRSFETAATTPSRVIDLDGTLVYADRQNSLALTPTVDDLPSAPENFDEIEQWFTPAETGGPITVILKPSGSTDATSVQVAADGTLTGTLPSELQPSTLEFFSDRTRLAKLYFDLGNYWSYYRGEVVMPDGTQWRNPFADVLAGPDVAVSNPTQPSKREYLGVPEDIAPTLRELTERITAGAITDTDRAIAIQNYLRSTGGFEYTTQIDPPAAGQSPVTAFLDSKRGYCIQFATAMVLMARSIGMPARLDVGYLVNKPWGDGWAVTSRNAHAWPEILFAGYNNWVRYEPTPAVQSGDAPLWARASTPATSLAPMAAPDPAVLPKMSGTPSPSGTSSVASAPSRTITAVAADAGTQAVPPHGSAWPWPAISLAVLAIALASVILARRRRLPTDGTADEIVWSRLAKTAHRAGLEWSDAATPRQVAAKLALTLEAPFPDAAAALGELAARVERSRYAPPTSTSGHATRTDEALIKDALRHCGPSRAARPRAGILRDNGLPLDDEGDSQRG